jgi:hypothetical protein
MGAESESGTSFRTPNFTILIHLRAARNCPPLKPCRSSFRKRSSLARASPFFRTTRPNTRDMHSLPARVRGLPHSDAHNLSAPNMTPERSTACPNSYATPFSSPFHQGDSPTPPSLCATPAMLQLNSRRPVLANAPQNDNDSKTPPTLPTANEPHPTLAIILALEPRIASRHENDEPSSRCPRLQNKSLLSTTDARGRAAKQLDSFEDVNEKVPEFGVRNEVPLSLLATRAYESSRTCFASKVFLEKRPRQQSIRNLFFTCDRAFMRGEGRRRDGFLLGFVRVGALGVWLVWALKVKAGLHPALQILVRRREEGADISNLGCG